MHIPWVTDPIRRILPGFFEHVGGSCAADPANIDSHEIHDEYESKSLGCVHIFPRHLVRRSLSLTEVHWFLAD
jgi:hypothetical protein